MPESEKVRSHILPEDRGFSFRLDDISLGVNDKLPLSANFSTDSLSSHHSLPLRYWFYKANSLPQIGKLFQTNEDIALLRASRMCECIIYTLQGI